MAIRALDLKDVDNNSINKYYTNIGKDRISIEKNSTNFDLKYILSVINSKLIKYFIKYSSKGKIDFYPDDWKKIPIKIIDRTIQEEFILLADKMLLLNNQLKDCVTKFNYRIINNFRLEKVGQKLKTFYEYDFNNFRNELKKQKTELSLKQQDEWEEYFNEHKEKILELQSQINQTDREIDQLVYQLYGLTEEEIKIVEGSVG
jgi:hypothetical protein